MLPTATQFNTLCHAGFVAIGQLAIISIDSTQRLFGITFDNTREVMESNQMTGAVKNNYFLPTLNDWSAVYHDNLQKVLAVAGTYWESTAQVRTELASLVEEQAANVNHSLLENLKPLVNAKRAKNKEVKECVPQE